MKFTPEQKQKLIATVESLHAQYPGIKDNEAAKKINDSGVFGGITLKTHNILQIRKKLGYYNPRGSKKTKPLNKKQRRDAEVEVPEGLIQDEAPTLKGLIERITEVETYALKLRDAQKRQVERLFL